MVSAPSPLGPALMSPQKDALADFCAITGAPRVSPPPPPPRSMSPDPLPTGSRTPGATSTSTSASTPPSTPFSRTPAHPRPASCPPSLTRTKVTRAIPPAPVITARRSRQRHHRHPRHRPVLCRPRLQAGRGRARRTRRHAQAAPPRVRAAVAPPRRVDPPRLDRRPQEHRVRPRHRSMRPADPSTAATRSTRSRLPSHASNTGSPPIRPTSAPCTTLPFSLPAPTASAVSVRPSPPPVPDPDPVQPRTPRSRTGLPSCISPSAGRRSSTTTTTTWSPTSQAGRAPTRTCGSSTCAHETTSP